MGPFLNSEKLIGKGCLFIPSLEQSLDCSSEWSIKKYDDTVCSFELVHSLTIIGYTEDVKTIYSFEPIDCSLYSLSVLGESFSELTGFAYFDEDYFGFSVINSQSSIFGKEEFLYERSKNSIHLTTSYSSLGKPVSNANITYEYFT